MNQPSWDARNAGGGDPQQAPPPPPQQPPPPPSAPPSGPPAAAGDAGHAAPAAPTPAPEAAGGFGPPPAGFGPAPEGYGPQPPAAGPGSGAPTGPYGPPNGYGPPFGAPPGAPPYGAPGAPGGPAAPGGRRRKAVLSASAGVVAAALVAGAVVWQPWAGGGGTAEKHHRTDPVAAARADIRAAATRLEKNRATGYDGDYTDVLDGAGTVALTSTPSGRVQGRVRSTGKDTSLDALSVDGSRVFFKGDKDFWKDRGLKDGVKLDDYSGNWVKAPLLLMGQTQLVKGLRPQAVAAAMRSAADARQVRPHGTGTVGGVKARRITAASTTYWISSAAPHRLVRVETAGSPRSSSPTPDPDNPGGPGSPGDPDPSQPPGDSDTKPIAVHGRNAAIGSGSLPRGVKLDVTEPSKADQQTFKSDFDGALDDLATSIDTDVTFSIPGKVKLSPCNTSGCTATADVENSDHRSSTDGDDDGDDDSSTVPTTVKIRMTLDGKEVRTCTINRTVDADSTDTFSCRANYTIPPSSSPTTHKVLARYSAVARGATSGQITHYKGDFSDEWAHPGASPAPSSPGSDSDPDSGSDSDSGSGGGSDAAS